MTETAEKAKATRAANQEKQQQKREEEQRVRNAIMATLYDATLSDAIPLADRLQAALLLNDLRKERNIYV